MDEQLRHLLGDPITMIFCLPFTPEAVPWNSEFSWEAFNYAPLTVAVVILLAWIGWMVSARKHFTGQIRETDIEEVSAAPDETGPARALRRVTFRGVTVDELRTGGCGGHGRHRGRWRSPTCRGACRASA